MIKIDPFKKLLLVIVLIMAIFMLPTPYVVVQPGKVEAVKSMVMIEDGYTTEKGSLMLTTVRMTYSNAGYYLMSYLIPHADLRKKAELLGEGETTKEYSNRQEINMLSSQSNAVLAAYNMSELPYEIITQEIRIYQTIAGMPASKALQAGDSILKIDGVPMSSTLVLMDYINGKKVGDMVSIEFLREKVKNEVDIHLVAHSKDEPRPVLGVYLTNIQTIQAKDKDKQIHVTAGEIGGPSAGLIFALEMYNQLVPEDITKGYHIAGTGTIDPSGIVGSIGGIEYKVVGAHRKKADFLFVPFGNAPDAIDKAKSIGTNMEIIPVKNMKEALDYLDSLPGK